MTSITQIYHTILEKYRIRATEVVDMDVESRNKKPKVKGELYVIKHLETQSASRNQGRAEAH